MIPPSLSCLFGVCAAIALGGQAVAQEPAASAAVEPQVYSSAAALLRQNIMPKLRNARVIPHWIGNTDEFWYAREIKAGREFVIVDAATGARRPAFDHGALAGALAQVIGEGVSAQQLPFDEFEFDAARASIKVSAKSRDYRCTLPSGPCAELKSQAGADVILSPDGHHGILTRDGNLWLRDLDSGAEHALTTDGAADFGYGIYYDGWKAAYIPRERAAKPLPPLESYWSPDSTRVIVSRIDQRHVSPYPFVESAPADGSFRPKLHQVRIPLAGEKAATMEWFVFDVRSGLKRRIEYPYAQLLVMQQDLMAVRKTWWSRDSRHLYAVAFGDNMESAFFFDADLDTGKVRTVIDEHAKPRVDLNSTSYNPPNVRLVGDGKEVIWFSQRDGWGHLYLYDGRTGRLKNQITRGPWLVRDVVQVDEKARRIYFTGGGREPGNPYYRYLYRVNFDGSDLKLLSPEHGDHLLTSPWNDVLAFDGAVGYQVVSPSGRYVVYTHAPVDKPPQTYARATADAHLISVVESADAAEVFAAGYRPPEELVLKAADGSSDVWAVVYRPPNLEAGKKYPVIDMQYASPLTAVAPRNFITALSGVPGYGNPASTAQLGFVVIAVDARGTTYRSREFSQSQPGYLQSMGLEDHIAAIRQLGQRYSYVDVDRVGITGASFGGWTALRAMLEFPDFFKVAVAGVPPASLNNMYLDYHWTVFQGPPVFSDGSQLRPNATEVAQNWKSADGNQQAGRLKGKLLMVMGELDENVVPGSPLQFVNALIKANKDFDLLYLPNTNHHESGNLYVVRRMWDYFVKNLQGLQPPAQFNISTAAPPAF